MNIYSDILMPILMCALCYLGLKFLDLILFIMEKLDERQIKKSMKLNDKNKSLITSPVAITDNNSNVFLHNEEITKISFQKNERPLLKKSEHSHKHHRSKSTDYFELTDNDTIVHSTHKKHSHDSNHSASHSSHSHHHLSDHGTSHHD